MIPLACAASRASAIWFAIGSASSSGSGPPAMRSASVGPSTSSMTSAHPTCPEPAEGAASFEPVEMRDVRMVQCRQRLRFALEAVDAFRIGGDRLGEDFDGDVPIELRVARAIDLAHAAAAKSIEDFVRAKS